MFDLSKYFTPQKIVTSEKTAQSLYPIFVVQKIKLNILYEGMKFLKPYFAILQKRVIIDFNNYLFKA